MRRLDVVLLAAMAAITVLFGAAALGRISALESRLAELEAREPMTVTVILPERHAAPESTPAMQSAEFTAYAYCSCRKCCGKWAAIGLTATGTKPAEGRTVAVDPDVIPLGTELWIDGAGPYVAEDTGSGIAGYTLDIYRASHEAAREWGVRTVTVSW